jgi:hypothetical protein
MKCEAEDESISLGHMYSYHLCAVRTATSSTRESRDHDVTTETHRCNIMGVNGSD